MKPITIILFALFSNQIYSQEKNLQLLKDFGFCTCIKNFDDKNIILKSDGSLSSYMQMSNINRYQISQVQSIVKNYLKYNTKKSRDPDHKLYIQNCLNMYNDKKFEWEIKKIIPKEDY